MTDSLKVAEEPGDSAALQGQIAARRNRAGATKTFAVLNGLGSAAVLGLDFVSRNHQPHYHDGADPSALLFAMVAAIGVMFLSPICLYLGVQGLRSGNQAVGIASLLSAITGIFIVLWLATTLGFI